MKPEILSSLIGYRRADLLADGLAGVTVAMVAIPLSLAIAIASGAPPGAGLVTAVVAGFLISALGGSRVQIGGPTGAFIVVVAGIAAVHGMDGLVIATFMAGLILIAAGLLRLGRLVEYVPEAVIDGFTIGIGIIIATSQLPDLFGLHLAAPAPAEFLPRLAALWDARATVSWPAVGIAALTVALITVLRRAFPRFPGLIVAIGAASALAVALDLPVDTIQSRFGDLPNHLPMPHIPDLSVARLAELLPSALVIAFLAGVESLLSALVADRMTGHHHRPNAEVMAQGWANLGSALFGGLPATGALARTATNIKAGARSPVAGIIHAATVLLVMIVAAPLAGQLAMPALAGLLLLTAWNMTEPQKWRHHLSLPRPQLALLVITLLLTVLADLTIAIGTGVLLGLILRRFQPRPENWTAPDR